jgi:FkbM family methyltransferase
MGDEVVTTPFGKFLVNPRDCVGTTLKAGTLWDGPGFLQVIAKEYGRLGEPGSTILDVGANIGSFAVYCASLGAWRVVAVEPVEATLRYLKANLDLNRATCAHVVIPLGVAAYDRRVRLLERDFDPDNLGGTVLALDAGGPIRGVPLDDYLWLYGTRVSLIKVDAQGCDGAALVGLDRTLRRDHPAVVFEWEADLAPAHGYSFRQLRAWLGDRGYTVEPWPSQPNNFLAIWRGAR